MKDYQFTAHIEREEETRMYVGYIPAVPGAYTQAESLDELYLNLKEVLELCLEEIPEEEIKQLQSQFIGTQEIRVAL